MSIAQNIARLEEELQGTGCRLVAVSKTKPVEKILEAYQAGQRLFGENKAQEMAAKFEELPQDIEWHMIGHLQRNKVKYIAPFVQLIQSVDSLRLLEEIEKQALHFDRTIDCLLQFYLAEEESKFGLTWEEARDLLESDTFKAMEKVRITGVMGVATNTDKAEQLKKEFRQLRHYFQQVKETYFPEEDSFKEISMGMSADYPLALAEGSTLIRVGSSIFGAREYGQGGEGEKR
ncbi:YggS family pyridoxal phosphate-dependent enzyme [soil metagenome]